MPTSFHPDEVTLATNEAKTPTMLKQDDSTNAQDGFMEPNAAKPVAGGILRPFQVRNFKLLTGAKLKTSALPGATFIGSTLVGTDFTRSDLTDVSFDDQTLENVTFSSTSLKRTSFRNAKLRNVSFHNTDVKHAMFDGAKMDKVTYAMLKSAEATLNDTVTI